MERLARIHAKRLRGIDWQDLLNSGLERILSGSRQWPRHLSLWVFLPGVLRSVADEMRKQQRRTEKPASEFWGVGDDGTDPIDNLADVTQLPDELLADQEQLAEVESLFEDDEQAYAVILAKMEGFSPAEAMSEFDMTKTEYQSAQKRVRRAFLKHGLVGK